MGFPEAAWRLARVRLSIQENETEYAEAAREAARILTAVEEMLLEISEGCPSVARLLPQRASEAVDRLVAGVEAASGDPPRLLSAASKLASFASEVYASAKAACSIALAFSAAAAVVVIAAFLVGLAGMTAASIAAVAMASLGVGLAVAGALLVKPWGRYYLLQIAGAAALVVLGLQLAPGAVTAAMLAAGSRLVSARVAAAGGG